MYDRFDYYGAPDIDWEMALDEFRLLPRTKGDLRGAKKGQVIIYKQNTVVGSGGEKKLTVTGTAKAKGYGTIILAKDEKGRTYQLPLNSDGQATVVLLKTGDPESPNQSMGVGKGIAAWLEDIEMNDDLAEACGKKKGKKSRKEDIERELAFLESTSSPFPEVRSRRIEELRAELEEAVDKTGYWLAVVNMKLPSWEGGPSVFPVGMTKAGTRDEAQAQFDKQSKTWRGRPASEDGLSLVRFDKAVSVPRKGWKGTLRDFLSKFGGKISSSIGSALR